jgi:hypothetical protein
LGEEQMNDNNVMGALLLAVLASIGVTFLLGARFGYDDGVVDGKNEGIVYCIEQLKNCKTTYDYLKLQEKQK